MPVQSLLLPAYWILPVSGLAGVGLGLHYRVPIAVVASVLFAAVAMGLALADGSGLLATLLIAFMTLFCLQLGYFIGALLTHR